MTKFLANKTLRSTDLTASYLEKISQTKWMNAFVSVFNDEALAAAKKADERRSAGLSLSPIDGLPIAIKDNFATTEGGTACASKMLQNFRAGYDATIVRRLKAAGAIILGKTNMDEFAMGSSNVHSLYGPVINPHSPPPLPARVAGGSSGGSGAAVGGGLCSGALGSDTGGSVRLPAAYCGIFGFKPRYGRLSRSGLVSFASSFDTPGIFGGNVGEAAMIYDVCKGVDELDSTSLPPESGDNSEIYLPAAKLSLSGLRIGVPKEYYVEEISDLALQLWEGGAETLAAAGAQVQSVSLPSTASSLPIYYVLTSAEASSNLARYDGVRYGFRATEAVGDIEALMTQTRTLGFGPEVKRRILAGCFVLSSEMYQSLFAKAQSLRAKVVTEFDEVFKNVDCLITPTCNSCAPLLATAGKDPIEEFANDVMMVPASLAGLAACSIPFGVNAEGMPMALQIISNSEQKMFKVAAALEQARKQ